MEGKERKGAGAALLAAALTVAAMTVSRAAGPAMGGEAGAGAPVTAPMGEDAAWAPCAGHAAGGAAARREMKGEHKFHTRKGGDGKAPGTRICTLCDVPLDDELQAGLRELCREYGVDYAMMVAMAETESGFDPHAVGADGELGMWQLMPSTAAQAEAALGRRLNLFDAWDSAEAAVWLMAHYTEKYGDKFRALMAYSMGEAGATRRLGDGLPRSEYAACVMTRASGYGYRRYFRHG